MESIKIRFGKHIHQLQDVICKAFEQADGLAVFKEEKWERPGGGGGRTRVIENGALFEKGGVNISEVKGEVTAVMKKQLQLEGNSFYASGISLVMHPFNPFTPTMHANFRYFELYDEANQMIDCWFGGGADLTPYYLFEEDAVLFHAALKNANDPFGKELYPKYKKWCDEYFANRHRNNEMRGIGGIFYDHMRPAENFDIEKLFSFQQSNANCFINAYLPIVEKRKNAIYNEQNKYWQEIRRGRYVEFNLIHDRGTIFGLKTNGRTESILMSLPPTVRFDYNYQPGVGSEEEKLLRVCLHPKDWLNIEVSDEEKDEWARRSNTC